MKKNQLLIFLLFVAAFSSTLRAQISNNGLIVYYPLRQGDIVNDGSPNGLIENLASNNYHLTPNSTNALSFVAGRNGANNNGNGALLLNGGTTQPVYDYSSNPSSFEPNSFDYSLGAWVALSTPYVNEYQYIASLGNNDLFLRFRKSGTTYYIQAGQRYNANQFYVINYTIPNPTAWLNDQWHQITLKKGGGYMALHVDGVEVDVNFSASQAVYYSPTNKSFRIGHFSDPNYYLNGKISDVFYYSRALDPSDFSKLTCDQTNVSPNTSAVNSCNFFSGSISSNLPSGAISYSWFTTPFGGTAVHTGNNFITPTLNTTTTYYVEATYAGGCKQKSYPRAKVRVNVNNSAVQPTNTTSNSNQSICSGNSTTLSATTTNGNIVWYNAPTAGSVLGTGNTFNTGPLSSTTTFYAAADSPGCGESNRTAIQVNVTSSTAPNPPTILTSVFTLCGNESITLLTSSPGNTIRWYDAATGGTLLQTGANYTTPVLTNPSAIGVQDQYTYYVESSNACGGSSTRVPVTVTVKYKYNVTAVSPTNVTVCQGTSAVLEITTPAPLTAVRWTTGFSIVATETLTLTTAPISSATIYTAVVDGGNGCTNNVDFNITTTTTQATAPVNSTPTQNQTICSGNTTTLSVNNTNAISWYSAATGGTLLGTGNSYTTNVLSNNTTFYAQNGSGICASTRTPIAVTVKQSNTGIATHTACGSFTWINGVTYTSSNNSATFSLTNSAGCDSVVTLNLTINQASTGIATVTECTSYTWINGVTYTTSTNTPTFTLTNAAGCDSVVTLHLTILNANTGTAIESACNSFTWINGVTYTSSTNTPTFTLTNAVGCDSVVTLNLTIFNDQTGTANVTACGTYTWIDGITYTSNNSTATFTLQSVHGCDSVVTLNLTFGTPNTGTATISACDSYTWIDGVTYTASTSTPTHTLTNVSGCDSLVTLNLTIKNSSASTATISSCDPIVWLDGNTYSTSTNTPTFTLTNAAGCDSVITLNLTITAVTPTITLSGNTLSTTATGGTYQWVNCSTEQDVASANSQTFTPTVSGDYAVEFTINGCTELSNCLTVSVVGLEDLGLETITVSPNPTRDNLNISSTSNTRISIVNLLGEELMQVELTAGQNQIETENFVPGVYLIHTAKGQTIRFVKL
ncbi:MAG: T9SS type A sorting domain-containing protein [Flavobacteriales bacterium]|nr:T9SS type A sorting domain-containing protein [Flavobacteriales bacterium]